MTYEFVTRFLSLIFGLISGIWLGISVMKARAVQHHCAHFDTRTGKWKWDELNDPCLAAVIRLGEERGISIVASRLGDGIKANTDFKSWNVVRQGRILSRHEYYWDAVCAALECE